MPNTTLSCQRIAAAAPVAAITRVTPTAMASRTLTTPAATGRYRLSGWARSAAASMESFRKYTPDETTQNRANVPSVRRNGPAWLSTPAAPGAANTRTFFGHWRGRAVRTRPARTEEGARPLPAAGVSGSTLLTAPMVFRARGLSPQPEVRHSVGGDVGPGGVLLITIGKDGIRDAPIGGDD